MHPKTLPSFEFFDRLLSYHPEIGTLIWKPRPVTNSRLNAWNTRFANQTAGTVNSNGYIKVNIDQRFYLGHRIAWLLYYGEPPPDDLDHKNHIKHDNRITNLRSASDEQNRQNVGKLRSNTSGHKGVCWVSAVRRWKADIKAFGQHTFLGYFKDLETAAAAYREAARRLHGEFAHY